MRAGTPSMEISNRAAGAFPIGIIGPFSFDPITGILACLARQFGDSYLAPSLEGSLLVGT
jgi:hypothetical protein